MCWVIYIIYTYIYNRIHVHMVPIICNVTIGLTAHLSGNLEKMVLQTSEHQDCLLQNSSMKINPWNNKAGTVRMLAWNRFLRSYSVFPLRIDTTETPVMFNVQAGKQLLIHFFNVELLKSVLSGFTMWFHILFLPQIVKSFEAEGEHINFVETS